MTFIHKNLSSYSNTVVSKAYKCGLAYIQPSNNLFFKLWSERDSRLERVTSICMRQLQVAYSGPSFVKEATWLLRREVLTSPQRGELSIRLSTSQQISYVSIDVSVSKQIEFVLPRAEIRGSLKKCRRRFFPFLEGKVVIF